MPVAGSGRPARFSTGTPPADRSDPRAHLVGYGFTDNQLRLVTSWHGNEGLEAMRHAYGYWLSAVSPSEQHALREHMTRIACRSDGVKMLRALYQHRDALSNGTSFPRIMNLTHERNGATKLAALAYLLDSGYTDAQLTSVMNQHGAGALDRLLAAHTRLSDGPLTEWHDGLPSRLLGIARQVEGMYLLKAIGGSPTGELAMLALDMAEQLQRVRQMASLPSLFVPSPADAQRALRETLRKLVRDAARPN